MGSPKLITETSGVLIQRMGGVWTIQMMNNDEFTATVKNVTSKSDLISL